jgi:alanyl-tRNA synthetase
MAPRPTASGPTALPRTSHEIRESFTGFFAARDHLILPSASLIPHDPTVLFTVAGMVPFKPYFVGDETPPGPRATSVQKCLRAGGKHNDLDDVGRTDRHLVFFEMLGNFSFGDYFKEKAIPWAWELVTEGWGIDPDRLWVTVHDSDDEAEEIWAESVGVPRHRIQRLGDEDNFWQMGDTGPCGPCSEIFYDYGPELGRDGGPKDGSEERFVEIWNLVFMQFDQATDGTRTPLPKPSIDTGAGLERVAAVLQGVYSVWDTDLLRGLIESASSVTGRKPGVDERTDVSLRILAEHARSSAMLVNDGVFPSNEDRGYVLRRIIRRAVRHAYLLGTEQLVLPKLVAEAIDVMTPAYPELTANRDFIEGVITREEERFRQTLRNGLGILDHELAELPPGAPLPGSSAFKLHDTYGFPLELTAEITAERGVEVDRAGFETEMSEQRRRAKDARKAGMEADDRLDAYRQIVEEFGLTEFTGYDDDATEARLVAVVPGDDGLIEVFADRTPFYAEAGGQVGDTGTITTATGTAEVVDTTYALPGLRRHVARVTDGAVQVGQMATLTIDRERRDAIRRNHTGTHMLHWALREVLGEHVKQAGSRVDPDRLRFDFSHYAAVTPEEIARVEALANHEVLLDHATRTVEVPMSEAQAMGAIAFFGDKYGDVVRVLEAGPSLELCGGTHVRATGEIGPIKVVSEGSIGSNLRRIEAVTGEHTLALVRRQDAALQQAAQLLGTTPDGVVDGVERRLEELKALRDELKAVRAQAATGQAAELASQSVGGVVVARVDGLTPGDLRELAIAVRQQPGTRASVLIGVSDTGGVSLASAVAPDAGLEAGALIKDAARAVGGGGGGKGPVATAGGKDASGIEEALAIARQAAGVG